MTAKSNGTYLEQCIEAVSNIDAAELAELRLVEEVGRGSGFITYRLGELTVGNVRPIAAKLPMPGRTSWERIVNELTDMQLLVGANRELQAKLPAFLGLLTVTGHDVAVITEDASDAGRKQLVQTTLDPTTKAAITEQLPSGAKLREKASDYLAFRAGAEERLLDATITPFVGNVRGRTELYYDVVAQLSQISIAVTPSSPLGISLVSRRQSL